MRKEISIPSNLNCLKIVRKFIRKSIPKNKFKKMTLEKIVLAIDEACANVIEHSYEMDDSKKFTLSLNNDRKKIKIVIEDKGVGIKDSSVAKKPDLVSYINKSKEGGLGRYMIENIMDEVSYKREEGLNTLSMVKYYDR
jgi:serine/threonine-protein kinase RsbW